MYPYYYAICIKNCYNFLISTFQRLFLNSPKYLSFQVISTCSTDAVDQLKKLGADIVINYKDQNADQLVKNEGM